MTRNVRESKKLAEEISDVKILVSTLDIMDTIVQEEVIGIGDPL